MKLCVLYSWWVQAGLKSLILRKHKEEVKGELFHGKCLFKVNYSIKKATFQIGWDDREAFYKFIVQM
jgi:hypothetical protein